VSIDTATFQFVNTYTASSNGVKTGDESGLAGWLALLLLAGAGAGYIAYSRKRENN
jgi:LPXTG-motif cell wall-anchored protein